MKQKKIIALTVALVLLPTLSLFFAAFKEKEPESVSEEHLPRVCNLEKILKNGELNVVIDNTSFNYFVYKGRPMGFQYEILLALASEMGVELNITVSNDVEKVLTDLDNGVYDIFAKNFVVTKERIKMVDFTEPVLLSRQVLIQRNKSTKSIPESIKVSDLLDLADKTIVVPAKSVFAQRLRNLSDEIGASINVVEDSTKTAEQLIELVSNGTIDYTVCNENLAKANVNLFDNIDISLPVSFNQKLSWAISKNSDEWKAYLDEWIASFKNSREYDRIVNRYFGNRTFAYTQNQEYHSVIGGKISIYDTLIQELSKKYGLDWRLVSAVVIQESGFNPEAESWMGACGLMQLMPQTAEIYGVDDLLDPRQNIKGGILHLKWLDSMLTQDIADPEERLKFTLAAYNVGLGHIYDARRLAKKYGKDENIWSENVETYLLNKSKEEYYNDSVVRHGYCNGSEPVEYVEKVLGNYGHYLNLIPEQQKEINTQTALQIQK